MATPSGFDSKTVTRRFKVEVTVPGPLEALVFDVLDQIELDQIPVFRPDDADAFVQGRGVEYETDDGVEGEMLIGQSADATASIREWLCVACQYIDFADEAEESDEQTLAIYRHNLSQVVLPLHGEGVMPEGPHAFVGGITLFGSTLRFARPNGQDAFRFIVAHELTHAFHALQILVPAMRDWETFWRIALDEGCRNEAASQLYDFHAAALDEYRQENELLSVQQFWPSKASQWFDALKRMDG